MSVTVQCLNCAQHFSAPEEACGRRVRCPACGGAIEVPPPLHGSGNLLDLLAEEEQRAQQAHPPLPTGFDPAKLAALGINPGELSSFGTPAGRARRRSRSGDPLGFLLTHKVVLAVTAASIGFFLLMMNLNTPLGAMGVGALGIGIALGKTRSQSLADSNRKAAQDWRSFERLLGI